MGMRVVQRVRGYRNDGEGDEDDRIADEEFQKELDQELAQYPEKSPGSDDGGGFMVNSEQGDTPVKAARMAQQQLPSGNENEDDDDLHDDDYGNDGGGFLPESETGSEGEEAVQPQRGVPSLAREPSLFGLENFDIPMAVPLSEDERDEYGGGFMVAESEDISMSSCTRAGITPGLTSPAVTLDKQSLADRDSITKQIDVSTAHSTQPAPAPSLTITPSSIDLAIDPPQVSKAVDADQTQPSPAPSSASSGFDDGLLLEDPEDEDAEPEWLL